MSETEQLADDNSDILDTFDSQPRLDLNPEHGKTISGRNPSPSDVDFPEDSPILE